MKKNPKLVDNIDQYPKLAAYGKETFYFISEYALEINLLILRHNNCFFVLSLIIIGNIWLLNVQFTTFCSGLVQNLSADCWTLELTDHRLNFLKFNFCIQYYNVKMLGKKSIVFKDGMMDNIFWRLNHFSLTLPSKIFFFRSSMF